MELYDIVRGTAGWAISQNNGKPEGSFATKESAFEAVYLAASNDIKKGLGVTISIEPAKGGEAATGGNP